MIKIIIAVLLIAFSAPLDGVAQAAARESNTQSDEAHDDASVASQALATAAAGVNAQKNLGTMLEAGRAQFSKEDFVFLKAQLAASGASSGPAPVIKSSGVSSAVVSLGSSLIAFEVISAIAVSFLSTTAMQAFL